VEKDEYFYLIVHISILIFLLSSKENVFSLFARSQLAFPAASKQNSALSKIMYQPGRFL
jgi:hypothetical protein